MICAFAIRRGNHLFRRRIFTVRRDDFTIRDNALFILVVEFHCCPVKVPDDYYKV